MTLGIDPGARQIGVAVLRGEELLFFAVKTFKRRNCADSLGKLQSVIKKLIDEYQIEFVAVEKTVFVQQHRSFVKIVSEEINVFLQKQNILFAEFNPKTIRQMICGHEKPTKRNAALILSQRYSEMVRYFNVPRLWQKRYFALLFGAVAVGLVGAIEIGEKKHFLRQISSTNHSKTRPG